MDADSFSPDFLVSLAFLPPEMQTLRVALASVGISCAAASVTSFGVHMLELIPTVLRYEFMDILPGHERGHSQLIGIYCKNKHNMAYLL